MKAPAVRGLVGSFGRRVGVGGSLGLGWVFLGEFFRIRFLDDEAV